MSRGHLRALAALTAAGAALRFATLDLQSFWFDEAVTAGLVRRGLGDMLAQIPRSESTPPLYYVVAWVWAKAFGSWEVGLRSLSAVLGTATIPMAYAAAAQLASRRAALAVAALAAFNPLLIWYSQEARSYALVLLLTTAALYFFARALERRPGRAVLALWVAACALAVSTHYFAAFVIVPQAAWLALRRPRSRAVMAAAAVACLAVLAALPLALHQRALDLTSFIAETSLVRRVVQTPKQYLVGFDAPAQTLAAGAAAVAVVAGVWLAVATLSGDERRGARLAAGLGTLAVAVPLVLAIAGTDYFQARNLIVAWVPFAVVLAAGLTSERAGSVGLAAVVGLCALGLLNVAGLLAEPNWRRDDWRGAAAAVGPARATTAVVGTPGAGGVPFRLYQPDAVPARSPTATARVSEVVLVSRSAAVAGSSYPSEPPRPPRIRIPGFAEVERHEHAAFTLVRLRAPRPVPVERRALEAYRLLPRSPPFYLLMPPQA